MDAFDSFSEFNKDEGGDIWFALDETRPVACFASIWTCFRKVKEGVTTNDLFAFLTTLTVTSEMIALMYRAVR